MERGEWLMIGMRCDLDAEEGIHCDLRRARVCHVEAH